MFERGTHGAVLTEAGSSFSSSTGFAHPRGKAAEIANRPDSTAAVITVAEKLEKALSKLSAEEAQKLALDVLHHELRMELDRRIAVHRQAVMAAIETWWRKYRLTLRDIESERDAAKSRLDGFLKELGYGG